MQPALSTSIAGTCNCFTDVRLLVSRWSDLWQFSDHDKAVGRMTPNTSTEMLGRNSGTLTELEDEKLRDMHLVECHEALYSPSRTPSKVADGAHSTQRAHRTEVQLEPSKIDERSRDSFLRFRDEWVRNRAREIWRAGSISLNTCSEDTASITALNEFYRWRVFDGFKAGDRDKKELGTGMTPVSSDFDSFTGDVTAVEKFRSHRDVCREKGRRFSRKTCRRRAGF